MSSSNVAISRILKQSRIQPPQSDPRARSAPADRPLAHPAHRCFATRGTPCDLETTHRMPLAAESRRTQCLSRHSRIARSALRGMASHGVLLVARASRGVLLAPRVHRTGCPLRHAHRTGCLSHRGRIARNAAHAMTASHGALLASCAHRMKCVGRQTKRTQCPSRHDGVEWNA